MKLVSIILATLFVCLIVVLGVKSYRQDRQSGFVSVTNEEFSKIIAEPKVQVVDVRTPGEFADGHIPGAINIDVRSVGFDKQISTLDKASPVAVYCRSGRRSKIAASKLSKLGFVVYDLDNGVVNWNGPLEQ